MSTLCAEATCSPSSNNTHRGICTPKPVQIKRIGSTARITMARWYKTIKQLLVTRYNQRIERQAFNNLLALDDRTLKDIGVTRQDVKWASRLPLSEDAAIKLEIITRCR